MGGVDVHGSRMNQADIVEQAHLQLVALCELTGMRPAVEAMAGDLSGSILCGEVAPGRARAQDEEGSFGHGFCGKSERVEAQRVEVFIEVWRHVLARRQLEVFVDALIFMA